MMKKNQDNKNMEAGQKNDAHWDDKLMIFLRRLKSGKVWYGRRGSIQSVTNILDDYIVKSLVCIEQYFETFSRYLIQVNFQI